MTMDISTLNFQNRDEFKREGIADKIIQLLTADIDISPMVIDGDWGTGKTEFCHKLINKFREAHQDARILYVDAFHADHADNPLMTILAAVMTLLPEGKNKKTFLQKAIPVARYGLATVGKAAVGHLLKQNSDAIANNLEEHLQDAADKAIDASVKALLRDHEKAEINLKALQATLESIASDSPIIIFIDELDRCRPDFAVQMLEVIKHTFDVKNVKFVLITNAKQLRAAINHCYGSLVDAQCYLDKFLKFSFRLPDVVIGKNTYALRDRLAAVEHLSNLVKASPTLKKTSLAKLNEEEFDFAKLLTEKNNLSLREVETFVRYLDIYQSLSGGLRSDMTFGHQLLRIFGVFLVCFAPDVVGSIMKDRADANQITALLSSYEWTKDVSKFSHGSHADGVAFMLARDSTVNSINDQLSEEFLQSWNNMERQYFDGWSFRGESKFDEIKKVITTLSLAGYDR